MTQLNNFLERNSKYFERDFITFFATNYLKIIILTLVFLLFYVLLRFFFRILEFREAFIFIIESYF